MISNKIVAFQDVETQSGKCRKYRALYDPFVTKLEDVEVLHRNLAHPGERMTVSIYKDNTHYVITIWQL